MRFSAWPKASQTCLFCSNFWSIYLHTWSRPSSYRTKTPVLIFKQLGWEKTRTYRKVKCCWEGMFEVTDETINHQLLTICSVKFVIFLLVCHRFRDFFGEGGHRGPIIFGLNVGESKADPVDRLSLNKSSVAFHAHRLLNFLPGWLRLRKSSILCRTMLNLFCMWIRALLAVALPLGWGHVFFSA